MVHSMTAFAREDIEAEWGAATWEVRSVNHRYLDVSLRLPEEFRALDAEVRKRVAAKVRRGKVECNLRIQPASGGEHGLSIDESLVDRLLAARRGIEERAGHPLRAPTAFEILRWPGVVEPPRLDRESAETAALELLEAALDILVGARAREGTKLAELLSRRCEEVAKIASHVREVLPDVEARFGARLRERLEEARLDPDEQRLAQEMVMFASRTDVAEELERLEAHVGEVRKRSRAPRRSAGGSTSSCRSCIAKPTRSARSRPTLASAGPPSSSRCSSSRCANRCRTSSRRESPWAEIGLRDSCS